MPGCCAKGRPAQNRDSNMPKKKADIFLSHPLLPLPHGLPPSFIPVSASLWELGTSIGIFCVTHSSRHSHHSAYGTFYARTLRFTLGTLPFAPPTEYFIPHTLGHASGALMLHVRYRTHHSRLCTAGTRDAGTGGACLWVVTEGMKTPSTHFLCTSGQPTGFPHRQWWLLCRVSQDWHQLPDPPWHRIRIQRSQ